MNRRNRMKRFGRTTEDIAMLHIVHLIERRFGPRAPRIIAVLLGASAIAIAVGLVIFQGL